MRELEDQYALAKRLARAIDNTKKLGRDNYTVSIIQGRQALLQETWKQFEANRVLLYDLPKEERKSVPYFTQDLAVVTEERYHEALDFFATVLAELSRSSPSPASPSSMDQKPWQLTGHLKLPTQPLPKFSGEDEEWEAFRDQFRSLVVDSSELNDVQRLQFLRQAVSGEAEQLIATMDITANNFSIAWDTLNRRYDDQERLKSHHFDALLSGQKMRTETAKSLSASITRVRNARSALAKFGRTPDQLWDDIGIHLVVSTFTEAARRDWFLAASRDYPNPTFDQFDTYVWERAKALRVSRDPVSRPVAPERRRIHTASLATADKRNCCCGKHQRFIDCSSFQSMSPTKRRDLIKRLNRCFNCFASSHTVPNCPKTTSCQTCHQRHNTLLHCDIPSSPMSSASNLVEKPPVADLPSVSTTATVHTVHLPPEGRTAHPRPSLLATALVQIVSASGRRMMARALIDPGAEVNFVTTRVVQTLRAACYPTDISVATVSGASPILIRRSASVSVSPHFGALFNLSVEALVTPSLTSYRPPSNLVLSSLPHLRVVPLADPNLASPEPISIILGASVYAAILRSGIRRGRPTEPLAQNTALGWIVLGGFSAPTSHSPSASTVPPVRSVHLNLANVDSLNCLNRTLERFWSIEEVASVSSVSSEEERCENHFVTTHSRHPDGRYVVRLPFRSDPPPPLGDSYPVAQRCMVTLQKRLTRDPPLATDYHAFMSEYARLGHMALTKDLPSTPCPPTFIPHHPVLREGSSTSRLRVVFNASSKSVTGRSLNDSLHVGPKLQSDLSAILLQWRQFPFVHSADIEKMYRQIWIDDRDIHHQQILWVDPRDPSAVVSFTLRTVTYGTACAPYLALRVLKQLADDHGSAYPLAQTIIRTQTYVDDVLFGGQSLTEVREKREQLISLLSQAGFRLRKWASNSPYLLSDIDERDHGLAMSKVFEPDEHLNVLGIRWSPTTDSFSVKLSLPASPPTTKRSILSLIARFYDPLGWITPVIISAKIFLQSLWSTSLGWDDDLPPTLLRQWIAIFDHLPGLSSVSLPRWTGQFSINARYCLHGFADASSSAYAAVVYLVTGDSSADRQVSLLVAKSRVAPRKSLTIPRLELSAALLLARLLSFVTSTFVTTPFTCRCWSDSTVVLAWLRGDPSQWKPFVAHRVSEIQNLLPNGQWGYVPSAQNPSDCASRGVKGSELNSHPLWWTGPPWLYSKEPLWPTEPPDPPSILPETRAHCLAVTVSDDQSEWDCRYSSWDRYVRVFAYVFRFINRCARRAPSIIPSPFLSSEEITSARDFWLKGIQSRCFPRELSALRHQSVVHTSSPLSSLLPYLDDHGLIRAGGRLQALADPYFAKQPIILGDHPITRLLIRHIHLRTMHGGPQLTAGLIRQDYWMIAGRRLVRSVIHACVVCARARAQLAHQVMGSLPAPRITPPARAFVHTGVDYAGPILLRSSSRRGAPSQKAYIALFVCLASRGIHLELVSDYSARAFRDAFDRFCSRRGLPESVSSDNGTTFVGAARALEQAFRSAIRNPEFQNRTATERIQWRFIPPASPHFGGLWEAGVKSVKHHLRRVVADHALTFEEYSTVLCRIEACLNSRPIAVLTDAIADPIPLTPGHLMVGGSLLLPPDPSLLDGPENRLSRWQLLRAVTERFWRLWAHNYVSALQPRKKWQVPSPNLEVNQVVLVHNPILPPGKWQLGRITKVHPGPDGFVRVVTIRTASSEVTRPITKVCLLPIGTDNAEANASSAS